MKAILKDDIIVALSNDGIEIGQCPKGVGLERLRFDGNKVIDLVTLQQIWVKHLGGASFGLHSVQVPGAQLITMGYVDRHRLFIEAGVIRLRTVEEIEAITSAKRSDMEDNKILRGEVATFVNNLTFAQVDQHIDTVFAGLNVAQKTSLKRLYKAVLFLSKRSLR